MRILFLLICLQLAIGQSAESYLRKLENEKHTSLLKLWGIEDGDIGVKIKSRRVCFSKIEFDLPDNLTLCHIPATECQDKDYVDIDELYVVYGAVIRNSENNLCGYVSVSYTNSPYYARRELVDLISSSSSCFPDRIGLSRVEEIGDDICFTENDSRLIYFIRDCIVIKIDTYWGGAQNVDTKKLAGYIDQKLKEENEKLNAQILQEQPKLTLLYQDWREKNPLSLEEKTMFTELTRTMHKMVEPKFRYDDEEILRMFANFFWSDRTKNRNSALRINKITLEENAIAGYLSQYASREGLKPDRIRRSIVFYVDKNQFESVVDTRSREETGSIHVDIYFGKTAEDALISLFQTNINCNMYWADILKYYQLKQGPGDACLVACGDGAPWYSDHYLILIRGNVAVYLESRYENFGCMDLACRLDAFLVEQFEKGQKDEVKAEE